MVRLEDLLPFIERKIQEDAAQQEDELREAGIIFFLKMIFGLGKKTALVVHLRVASILKSFKVIRLNR